MKTHAALPERAPGQVLGFGRQQLQPPPPPPAPDARALESAALARCAAVAQGDAEPAGDEREANVLRLAGMVLQSRHPAAASRLSHASATFFARHPQALRAPEEVLRAGWVVSLPRLRDMLCAQLRVNGRLPAAAAMEPHKP